MRLASITLPTHDNVGAPLNDVHSALRADIVAVFGGYTAYGATGAWRDDTDSAVITESVCVYLIACDDTAKTRDTLDSLARFFGHMARQKCVFITLPDGTARIVPATYRVPHVARDAIDAVTLA